MAWVWRLKNHTTKPEDESRKEVLDTIERFNDDDSSYKERKVGDTVLAYDKFVLLIDATDDEFTTELEEDYGVFSIFLSSDNMPVTRTSQYDYYVETDSAHFTADTYKILSAFSK